MKNEYTLGKGIARAGMWIAIAIVIAVSLSFINDRLRDTYSETRLFEPLVKPIQDCYYEDKGLNITSGIDEVLVCTYYKEYCVCEYEVQE